ncbi:MAG: MBL fold metallo-hydrolase, partial [Lachnospiraceae bacterium]|nr:MBL fold metallo-hydrolase [Lachnospiraceae bacterium]
MLENNLSQNRALTAEHGLSFMVETARAKILFDCSAGSAARKNAGKMNVSLADVDYVVLSHSHYDHAGGYPDMAAHGVRAPLITGPRFFEEKYARDGGKYVYLGCGFGEEFLTENGIERRICEGCETLEKGCHVVGGFKRFYEFEKAPARFVRQTSEGMIADDFPDEVCL